MLSYLRTRCLSARNLHYPNISQILSISTSPTDDVKLGDNEYDVVFYHRPFGLDLKWDEISSAILVERSAWKNIKNNSQLILINNERDHNLQNFHSTIDYLKNCSLPLKLRFIHIPNISQSIFTNNFPTFSQHMSQMSANDIIEFLHVQWYFQWNLYEQNKDNQIFVEKHEWICLLMKIFFNLNWKHFEADIKPLITGIMDDESNENEFFKGLNLLNIEVNHSTIKLQLEQNAQQLRNSKTMNNSSVEISQLTNIMIHHLSIWILYNIEYLRFNSTDDQYLSSNYLQNYRSSELLTNNAIKRMSNSDFLEWVSTFLTSDDEQKKNSMNVQSITNDWDAISTFIRTCYSTNDGINFDSDSKKLWNGNDFYFASFGEIFERMINSGNENISKNVYNLCYTLYSIIHRVERKETPVFNLMMHRRSQIQKSLGLQTTDVKDENGSESGQQIIDSLMESIADNNLTFNNNQWYVNSDSEEKQFVQRFLDIHGFSSQSSKFESMSKLSQMKRKDLKEKDMCAKTRKKILRAVNHWMEVNNIVKYGAFPYYKTDGNRSSLPSSSQVKAEIAKCKNEKLFYVPFANYKELKAIVRRNHGKQRQKKLL